MVLVKLGLPLHETFVSTKLEQDLEVEYVNMEGF